MPYFICQACQESVKGSKLDSHWRTKCPSCDEVACVDCGQSFFGSGYKGHSQCVSEAKKYQGHLYESSTEKKKASAVDKFAAVLEAATEKHAGSETGKLLGQLIGNTTVPRKRKAFLNFCGNSLRIRNQKLAESVWNAIDTERQIATAKADAVAKEAKAAKEAIKLKEAAAAAESTDKKSAAGKKPKKEKKEKKEKSSRKRSRDDAEQVEPAGSTAPETSASVDTDASSSASGTTAGSSTSSVSTGQSVCIAALASLQRVAKKAKVELKSLVGAGTTSQELVSKAAKHLWKKHAEELSLGSKREAKLAIKSQLEALTA